MPIKLTHEFVAKQFAAEKYQLLTEYKKSNSKVTAVCDKGHVHTIRFSDFRRGVRCAYCSKLRIDPEHVKTEFEKEGYQLLSNYVNCRKKIDFICPLGHRHAISWNSFGRGQRCFYCTASVITNEHVKTEFEKEGYQLLSEYKNSHERLEFICPLGHRHAISWNSFRNGHRCAYCAGLAVTPHQVKTEFEKEGYQLLSEYINNRIKLDFICPQGHQSSINMASFSQGVRCSLCYSTRVTHEHVKTEFEKEGYQLLSEYENSVKKLKFLCPSGHHHSVSWNNFRNGVRCSGCSINGYTATRPGRLYYLYFPDFQLYKIGITNRTIAKRFLREQNKYLVLMDEYSKDGSIAQNKERDILQQFKADRYKGPKVLNDGNSELFVRDVLGLNPCVVA